MSDFLLSVAGDYSPILKQAVGTAKQVEAHFNRIKIGGGIAKPLGEITGKANQFNSSLAASNARVIAFGASAGIVFGVQKAFTELVRATVEVGKSLAEININLGATKSELKGFSTEIFNIAKLTGQSFADVASAAKELSRQGLGSAEVLKRTRDALILTRLSGLDTEKSVSALTAAINSFSKSALDSSEIVAKFARVDANFAVSSKDLAEAFSRVGSSAEDAGVSVDELIGLVTSAQQTTSRGGAVIGNALKTIFARVENNDTISQLRELGVAIDSTQTGFQKLQAVSDTVKNVSNEQANAIKKLVGGVYQYNIISATLNDLGKNFSTVARATEDSSRATDEAIIKNQELNKTLAATINESFVNLKKLGATIGESSISPLIKNTLELFNEQFSGETSKGIGATIGKGLIEGMGQFITGPGALLIFGSLFSITGKFAKDAVGAFKSVTGLNAEKEKTLQIQSLIIQQLANEPSIQQQIIKGELTILGLKEKALQLAQATLLTNQAAAAAAPTILSALRGQGIDIGKDSFGNQNFVTSKKTGFIPNLAKDPYSDAISEAIKRENASLKSGAKVKVGKSPRLVSQDNPLGLGVYNTKDEPLGLEQGISRALKEGRDPRTYGGDIVPRFANYYKNVASSFPDPFNRPPGDALLNPQEQTGLDAEISKLKKQIQLGQRSQESLNNAVESLSKQYNLTSNSTAKVQSQLDKSLKFFNNKVSPFGSSLQGTTGQLFGNFGNQLGFNEAGNQGEFLGLVNDVGFNARQRNLKRGVGDYVSSKTQKQLIEEENAKVNDLLFGYARPAKATSSQVASGVDEYINSKTAAQKLKEYNDHVNDLLFDTSNIDKQKAAIQIEQGKRLNELSKKASTIFGGFAGIGGRFKSSSVKELESFGQSGQDALIGAQAQRAGRIQNAALLASFTAPLLGGIAKEAFGDRSTAARGAGATAQGIGNIASFAALGTSFGGPYGALGGAALGAVLSLPEIVKGFTDTLPDLRREIDETTSKINKSRDAFGQFAQNYELINEAEKGNISITSRRLARIKSENNARFNAIGYDPEDNLSLRKALSSGGFEGFKDEFERQQSRVSNKLNSQNIQAALSEFSKNENGRFFSILNKGGNKAGLFESLEEAFKGGSPKFGLTNEGLEKRRSIVSLTESLTNDRGDNIIESLKKDFQSNFNSLFGLKEEFSKLGINAGIGSDIASRGAITQQLEKEQDPRKFFEILRDFSASTGNKELSGTFSSLLEKGDFSLFQEYAKRFTSKNIEEQIKFDAEDAKARKKLVQIINNFTDSLFDASVILTKQVSAIQRRFEVGTVTRENTLNSRNITRQGNLSFSSNFLTPEDLTQARSRESLFEIRGRFSSDIKGLQEKRTTDIQAAIQETISNIYAETGKKIIEETKGTSPEIVNQKISDAKKNLDARLAGINETNLPEVLKRFQGKTGLSENSAIIRQQEEDLKKLLGVILKIKEASQTDSAKLKESVLGKGGLLDQQELKNIQALREAQLNRVIGTGGGLKGGLDSQGLFQNAQSLRLGLFGNNGSRTQSLISLTEQLQEFNPKINPFQNLIVEGRANNLVQQSQLLGGNLNPDLARRVSEVQYAKQFKSRTVSPEEVSSITKELDRAFSGVSDSLKKLAESAKTGDYEAAAQAAKTYSKALVELSTETQVRSNIIEKATLEEKKRQGVILSDDYAQQRLGARINDVTFKDIGGKQAINEAGGAFVDQFRYGVKDFYADSIKGAAETARQIKSSLGDAFSSFIDGTKTAKEAFRSFGLTVARGLVNKTTDIAINSLLGGATNLLTPKSSGGAGAAGGIVNGIAGFLQSLGRANGGIIQKYSSGGYVSGGSGVRDDVPALLSSGEYVVKKSAVQKIGRKNLENLNKNSDPIQKTIISRSNDGLAVRFANNFVYNNRRRPTSAALAFDPNLSILALTDENNPQNQARLEKESNFYQYRSDFRSYLKQKRDALKQYNRGEKQRVIGAYISAASTLAGGALGQIGKSASSAYSEPKNSFGGSRSFDYNSLRTTGNSYGFLNGAYYNPKTIPKAYAYGGKVFGAQTPSDRVPAMLTGGEFVIRKPVVDRLGEGFFKSINSGKYANGGLVGPSTVQSPVNDLSGISSVVTKLAEAANGLKTAITEIGGGKPQSGVNKSNDKSEQIINNVTISVTVQKDGTTKEDDKSSSNSRNSDDEKQAKALADRMKAVALSVINQELHPGGRLAKAR